MVTFGLDLGGMSILAAARACAAGKASPSVDFAQESRLTFQSATQVGPALICDIINQCFNSYIGGSVHYTVARLFDHVRRDGVDLNVSIVAFANDVPVAIALVARRGTASRLSLLGVAPLYKGHGVDFHLLDSLLQQSHNRGDVSFHAESFAQIEATTRLFSAGGLTTTHQLFGYHLDPCSSPSLLRQVEARTLIAQLAEIDPYVVASTLMMHGPATLPWPVSSVTVATMAPPAFRAYSLGCAQAVITDPDRSTIRLRALIVPTEHRNKGHATRLLLALMSKFSDRTWNVPVVCPAPQTGHTDLFEKMGFVPDSLVGYLWERRFGHVT